MFLASCLDCIPIPPVALLESWERSVQASGLLLVLSFELRKQEKLEEPGTQRAGILGRKKR